MDALGPEASEPERVYFTGGATAVLYGWRSSTIAVDIKVVPEGDAIFRALPRLKEELRINIELAAPDQFIPELPGWRDRSPFIGSVGRTSFHHYDLYAQALAKVERGHTQDLQDVREMLARQLIDPTRTLSFLSAIEPELFRYPAVSPAAFRRAAEDIFRPRD